MNEDFALPDPFIEMKMQGAGGKAEFADDAVTILSASGRFKVEMKRQVSPTHLDLALSVLTMMVMKESS